MLTLELFTAELSKYKSLSEKLTKTCESLQTEINLLNKLIVLEKKFSDQLLKGLFVAYEENFRHKQQNYRHIDAWNRLEEQKSVAKQNESEVKKLRQELDSWRQNSHRLDNGIDGSEETYSCSSGTDSMTVLNDKTSEDNESQRTASTQSVSSETQTSTIPVVPKTVTTAVVKQEVNTCDIPSVDVELEVIPKTEPEEEVKPSVDDDCIIEGVLPAPPSPPSSSPFLFVSEYLSKNKAFSHLLDKSKDKNKENSSEDKTIAIDLNNDSDSESNPRPDEQPIPRPPPPAAPVPTIFDDNIVDLTPKVVSPQKKSPKKSFIKKRVRFGKKRKPVRTVAKAVDVLTSNTLSASNSDQNVDKDLNKRMIGSNRKKIHFNPDNTISIFEVRGRSISSEKKNTSKKENRLNTSTAPKAPTPDPSKSQLNRNERANYNEDYIKRTKNIVKKGKTYYCRWKGCSYSTDLRSIAIRHHWKHTGETPFKCELCPQGFRDKRRLVSHVMTHNTTQTTVKNRVKPIPQTNSRQSSAPLTRGTGDHTCPECNGKYPTFQHMMRHMRRIHGKEKAFKYRQQNRTLRKNTTEADKQKTKRNSIERPPKARPVLSLKPISPKKFYKKTEISAKNSKQTANDLINTELSATEGEGNEWKCDFKSCLRSYSSKCNLKRHQLEIHKKVSKPLFFGILKNKDVKYFIPKTPQIGGNSPKKTKQLKPIENPKTTVPQPDTTSPEKEFSCNYKTCSKSFVTISGLYKHKKTVHMSKPSVANKFKSSATAQHSDNSTGGSAIAKKKTQNKFTTSAERTFMCPEKGCGSGFVWPKNLKTHLRVKHNICNVKEVIPAPEVVPEEAVAEKFECPYPDCPFEASSRHKQVLHYKTHFSSEDKPYKCLITGCDYSAKKLSLLKSHVLNRHSEQQFFRAMEESGIYYPSWS